MSLIGVDLGTRKVATAVFAEGDQGLRMYAAEAYQAPADIDRGWQLLEIARFVADQALSFEADQVWIEDVIVGNNHKYSLQLAEVLGAVLAALAVHPRGIDVRVVGNKAWKKEMVGNGNAGKDAVRSYITATHPDYALLCGEDQDRFDACCIGLYGLRIAARARDLDLSPE